jgi:transaldolase/glucose-6-phosphate isomerase
MEDARRLFARVDRPNATIKIPGTEEGTPAIEQMLYEGVNINITLLFSLKAYRQVAEAYLRALERRAEEGKPIDNIHSVASFFVSRVDTEADKRLEQVIAEDPDSDRARKAANLRGKLAVANAKLAYQDFKEIFGSERFKKLQKLGARLQRPLWASTSTKNPAYSDTLYVDELIGPNTVQTLAPASIKAFSDHGTLAETVEKDLDDARRVFAELEEVGVSYDDITDTLVREGVASFAKSFESMLAGLGAKRQSFAEEAQKERMQALGDLANGVQQALDTLTKQDAAKRLGECDPTLWGGDADMQRSVRNRLGWVQVVDAMLAQAHAGYFAELAQDVRARDFEFTVLLGMGGSSLAPDVFSRMFGPEEDFPELIVLDTTDPDSIAKVEAKTIGRNTLFIVSTKSGTTVETMSLYRYFFERHEQDASRFIAITDPGTPLEKEARDKGFWKVFTNPADIGGRYSALSYFGLVPLATLGVDVEGFLSQAVTMLPVREAQHPGVWLGAVLGAAQKAGRDKLTLVTSLGWGPFADWLEQLIAESTGKHGTGIVPVIAESLFDVDRYGDDRLFAYFRGTDGGGEEDQLVDAIRKQGHPVVIIDVEGPESLGTEFVRWEVATAAAGLLLGINPFDEPNVQEAKDATNEVLMGTRDAPPEPMLPEQAIDRIVADVKPRGYLSILAYVARSDEMDAAVAELRNALWQRTGVATTVGFGPRYLHSTGQLHKGGPSEGAFLMIVDDPTIDIEIPGAAYTFGNLFAAQSAGDAITLAKHNLPVVRVKTEGRAMEIVGQLTALASSRQTSAADD